MIEKDKKLYQLTREELLEIYATVPTYALREQLRHFGWITPGNASKSSRAWHRCACKALPVEFGMSINQVRKYLKLDEKAPIPKEIKVVGYRDAYNYTFDVYDQPAADKYRERQIRQAEKAKKAAEDAAVKDPA